MEEDSLIYEGKQASGRGSAPQTARHLFFTPRITDRNDARTLRMKHRRLNCGSAVDAVTIEETQG